MESVWARTSRAVPGQDVMPMTSTMLKIDCQGSSVEITMASGRNGMTRNQSVIRSSTAPNQLA